MSFNVHFTGLPVIHQIDEVWRYCSPNSIPLWLARCVKEGRKRGLRVLVNAQEPHRLNGRITSEMSELICFRLQLPRALEWLDDFGVARAGFAALPQLRFITRNLDSAGESRGKIRL